MKKQTTKNLTKPTKPNPTQPKQTKHNQENQPTNQKLQTNQPHSPQPPKKSLECQGYSWRRKVQLLYVMSFFPILYTGQTGSFINEFNMCAPENVYKEKS